MQAAKKRKLGRKHAAEVAEREKASLENALSWQTKAIQIGPPPQVPQGMAAALALCPPPPPPPPICQRRQRLLRARLVRRQPK